MNAAEVALPRRKHRAPPTVIYVRRNNRQVGVPIAEVMPSPEQAAEDIKIAAERHAWAHRALLAIKGREFDVVWRHYGFHTGVPMDLGQVADDLDIAYKTAENHLNKAKTRMRKALGIRGRAANRVWWTGSEGYGW